MDIDDFKNVTTCVCFGVIMLFIIIIATYTMSINEHLEKITKNCVMVDNTMYCEVAK